MDKEKQCTECYTFPSGIKIQCQREAGHTKNHVAEWDGVEGFYKTWWD